MILTENVQFNPLTFSICYLVLYDKILCLLLQHFTLLLSDVKVLL